MPQTTYYAAAFVATVAVNLTLAAVAWRRRSVPGSTYFALMMISGAWWAFSYAMLALSEEQSLWVLLSTLGDCTMPVFFMLFALSYWRPDIRIRLQYQVLIWLIPVATVIIALTNGSHGFLLSEIPPSVENANILLFEHGPWFYVTMIYDFLTMWIGVVFLFRAATSLSRIYRRQALVVLVAAVIPWIANALFLFNFSPVPGLNIAPIMASVTGLLLAFGIVKFQLFKVLPIAKEVVYKQIENGVLVVNSQGIVVDINPAAVKMLSGEVEVGQRLGTVIKDRIGLSFPLPSVHQRTEVSSGNREKPLWLDVVITPLFDRHNQISGHLIMLNDISELRKAEDALRLGEEKYRFLTERMNDIVWTMGLDFKPTYTSSSIFKVLGFTPEERAGKTLKELVTPESYEHIMNVFTAEMEREGREGVDPDRTVTIEAEYYHKNGSIVWLEHMVSANRDQQGKIIGLYAVSRDITERKRAEEALRQSEAKYRSLTEKMNDIVWIMRLEDLSTTYVSPSVFKVLGFTPDEFMKRQVQDQLTLESLRLVTQTWTAELERDEKEGSDPERTMALELEYYRKDGSTVWMENVVSAIRNDQGKAVGLHGVSRDITERKRMEEALRQSEQKFKDLAEQLPQTIFELDLEGRFTYANRYGLEFHGYTLEEAGNGINAMDLFIPEQKQKAIDNIAKILRGETYDDHEYSVRKKDGSTYPALIYSNAIMQGGRPIGIRGIVVDITERKKIEQMKTDFVSFISHQLRTPTAGLMGYIDNMLDGITGELNDRQAEYLTEMRDVCQRNNRLIADLLNVSRLERGVLVANINPVALREVVDTAVKEHRKAIEQKGLALNIKEVGKGIVVLADTDKLVEVLKNVIHNASKFTTVGSIDIEISSRGSEGIVKIKDTGVGMADEVAKDLFKKEKVFGAAIAVGGGAGLGLYIAKGFMKLQDGDIMVESKPGKGSTFIISLPLK